MEGGRERGLEVGKEKGGEVLARLCLLRCDEMGWDGIDG